jgi:hypothetical protein
MYVLSTTVEHDIDLGVTMVRADATLSLASARTMRATLLKVAAECPPAVVVDVTGCDATTPVALTVFPAVARGGPDHPPVLMVLWGARDALLQGGGRAALGAVECFDTRRAALDAAASHRVVQRREFCSAIRSASAPTHARNSISRICREWGPEHVRLPASLIISELATNAVVHAESDLRVEAVLRGDFLHLRVRDHSAAPPVPRLPAGAETSRMVGEVCGLSTGAAPRWGMRSVLPATARSSGPHCGCVRPASTRWEDDVPPTLTADGDPLGVDTFASHRLSLDATPNSYVAFQENRRNSQGAVQPVGARARSGRVRLSHS